MAAIRAGLLGGSSELEQAARQALDGYATVRRIGTDDVGPVDVLIVLIESPVEHGIQLIARCRIARPATPIILVATSIDPDLAVELVKCGVNDLLTLAIVKDALKPKIERALRAKPGPTVRPALLDTFQPTEPLASVNRRRCFRAVPPRSRPVAVHVRIEGRDVALGVVDMSIPNEGWPGGLLLRTDTATARLLPFREWSSGLYVEMALHLPDGGAPIAITGRLLPGWRRRSRVDVCLALQYVIDDPQKGGRVRTFWTECQRWSPELRQA